jgi:hypothetical protein
MSKFIIHYKIDEDVDPQKVKDQWSIGGSTSIQYNDVVLTKSKFEGDDGYLGNWIFDEILGFIKAIKWLSMGEGYINEIMEESIGFYTKFKDDQVFFSVVPVGIDDEFAEDIRKGYPCGEKGCPIPAKLFYNEVVRVGYEFLNDIIKKYKNFNKKEIEEYRKLLKDSEELVDKYNKTH